MATIADFDVNFDLKGFNAIIYVVFGLLALWILKKV